MKHYEALERGRLNSMCLHWISEYLNVTLGSHRGTSLAADGILRQKELPQSLVQRHRTMFNNNMTSENNKMLRMSKGTQIHPKLSQDRPGPAWCGLGIFCGLRWETYRMIKLYANRDGSRRPLRAATGLPEVLVILAWGTKHREMFVTW